MTPASRQMIIRRYQAAKHRLLFLDMTALWPTGLDERSPCQRKYKIGSVIRQLTQRTYHCRDYSGRDHSISATL